MTKTICILTSMFPYGRGEPFLETEVKFWSGLPGVRVVFIPGKVVGSPRALPPDVVVDVSVARRETVVWKLLTLPAALFSDLLIRELSWLRKNRRLTVTNFLAAWLKVSSVLLTYHSLRRKFSQADHPVICYSYWFDTSAYAAALLKRDGLVSRLFARAHRFDVYEEHQSRLHMPLKRQFVNDFDVIFPVSESARSYLHSRYGLPVNRLRVSRLGVIMGESVSAPADESRLSILSISSCVRIKRIDRIIAAIALAAQQIDKGRSIIWVHIGDGRLRHDLENEALRLLSPLENVEYNFLGYLSNNDVLSYLRDNNIDVLINTSESEGIPVSFMEAMSYGIPVVAPNVGGIVEIVNGDNGYLLSEQPSAEEVASVLLRFEHYKSNHVRSMARRRIEDDFRADVNYRRFIVEILESN